MTSIQGHMEEHEVDDTKYESLLKGETVRIDMIDWDHTAPLRPYSPVLIVCKGKEPFICDIVGYHYSKSDEIHEYHFRKAERNC